MRKTLLLCAVGGVVLSGCASTSPAAQRAGDAARCRSYGFRAGSAEFARCLLEVDLDRAADRRAAQRLLYGGFGYGYGPGWPGYGRYGGRW